MTVVALMAFRHARKLRADRLAAADAPSHSELVAARKTVVEPRELRLLAPSQRARYLDGWRGVETTFAGDPEAGIAAADHIVREVAMELGYPTTSFHELARGLALDFPDEVDAYCMAHAVAVENERRPVSHRQLRGAIRGYRTVFRRLTAPVQITELEVDRPHTEVHERRRSW